MRVVCIRWRHRAEALVVAIGYWDDHGHVGAGMRLLAQFATAFLALVLLEGLPALVLGP